MANASSYSTKMNINEFETIPSKEIGEDVRLFFKFSDEKITLTDKIVKIIDPKKSFSVLDIGCGEGFVIRKIHKKVKCCVVLDPDSKMLEILRKNVGDNSNIEFVNSTFENFKTDEKFDITISSHALSSFKDKHQAISKMLDYTKGDGKLILALHCHSSEQLQMLREMFHLIRGREIKHIFAETLQDYLRELGFESSLEKIESVATFPGIDIPLELSYFLFRTNYRKASVNKQLKIRKYLESKRNNHTIKIRTLHGILTLEKTSSRT